MNKSFLNPTIFFVLILLFFTFSTCNKSSTGNDNKEKPEINISVSNADISNGSGEYNFGDITVGSTSGVVVFTIENIGTDTLTLAGEPQVSFSNGDADNFSITTQPNTDVSPSGSTTFNVTFSPLSEGTKTATVNIPNNDTDNSPYTFSISGTGVAPAYSGQEIIDMFNTVFNVSATSIVTFTGPVIPGTIIKEQTIEGYDPTELQVPQQEGTYYAFSIDNEPDMYYSHDMDYAWLDMETGTIGTEMDVFWPVEIRQPDKTPTPFVMVDSLNVNGVVYYQMSGDGYPEYDDYSGDPTPEISLLKPYVEREPIKLALTLSGGEFLQNPNLNKRMNDLLAEPMHDWLKDKHNFQTINVNQNGGQGVPKFSSSAQFFALLNNVATVFINAGEPDCGCDEFFLYLVAHGLPATQNGRNLPAGFVIRVGARYQLIKYEDIYTTIKDVFPDWVKVTLLVESCFSGRMITEFSDEINAICADQCALTVLSTASNTKPASAPTSLTDQRGATSVFLNANNQDYDGDGIPGDIQDRFTQMFYQKDDQGPRWFHCPDGGTWCSTDGPIPPEITSTCIGVTHGSGESYITVCVKLCRRPSEPEHTVKFTTTAGSTDEGELTTVTENGEACVIFTIGSYGTYKFEGEIMYEGQVLKIPELSITVNENNVPCEL